MRTITRFGACQTFARDAHDENRQTRRETRRDAREDDIAVTDDGIKYVTFGFVLSAPQRVQAREEEAKL